MGWEDAVRLLSSSEVRVGVRINEGMGGFGEEGGREAGVQQVGCPIEEMWDWLRG